MIEPSELRAETFPSPIWKQLPDAAQGDAKDHIVYEAVGRSLSKFEQLDAMLSHLFAFLVTGDPHAIAARRSYGSPRSFDTRRK